VALIDPTTIVAAEPDILHRAIDRHIADARIASPRRRSRSGEGPEALRRRFSLAGTGALELGGVGNPLAYYKKADRLPEGLPVVDQYRARLDIADLAQLSLILTCSSARDANVLAAILTALPHVIKVRETEAEMVRRIVEGTQIVAQENAVHVVMQFPTEELVRRLSGAPKVSRALDKVISHRE
jgi:hypothetical protein